MTSIQSYSNTAQTRRFHRSRVRDGAAERLLAAMSEPGTPHPVRPFETDGTGRPTAFARQARESDRAYFRRRFGQERRAAAEAASDGARRAHAELAHHYARLSGRRVLAKPRYQPRLPDARIEKTSEAMRQSELLDEALKGTFPASDPVSVAFVH